MRSSCAFWLALFTLIDGPVVPALRTAAGQSPPAARAKAAPQPSAPAAINDLDEELRRQRQIIDRFMTVLERNPRRGTALDKVYGFHVENGSIEEFVKQLRQRLAAQPDDGAGWIMLGLIESQRGRDAAAVEALTKAKELRPADALAAYYLGQSLVLVGQPDQAAAAFEEAISRKPAPADLLEIFQSLGRVHQRAQRTAEALEVWNRLEKLFPGDLRVQEQIAVTLVEEGQSAEALPRYELLAKSTTDDYRRTVYRMEASELKIKLKRAGEGIADLEQLLAKLNPESWLFREVRRKIEEVFLRTDDQDGLAKYYAAWLVKSPEDIEAMARLARVLARQARVPEAQEWLNKALKLAPSRKELRLAFIEQLVDDQRYADAVQQYVELDKTDPNNPDYLRDWGKLVLRDITKEKAQRQVEAEKIWRRLLAARPSDPLSATQVADLFRMAEMQPQALELYEKAVALAPASPQYREYLGEYYHILQRPEEALATWRKMADGNQRTAANVGRLAEVLAQFGYLKEALPEIAAACELDPKDFTLPLKAADFAIRAEQYDLALRSLSRAEQLAQNDEEREAVLSQQIKTYTLQNKLSDLAAQLARETAGGQGSHPQWFLLARYREALHEFPEATSAIGEALKLEPNDIRSLASAARIAEQSGDLKTAADLNRKLAIVDRRGRSDYLQHVAGLESQLGRIDEALAAGRELIAAAPGNVETYQFFADLCFRLGRTEDGLSALRRATRVNPNEQGLLLALAAALAGQFRTDEAVELYWQAFEKGKVLDDKLSVITKLAELYLQINHFDQLLERLERGRREADQRREMTICLAQAYQAAGDYGMARQELERLLSENMRDTTLLFQLSKLAESESDVISAVKYQEQLAKLAPGAESEYRLATLLSRSGDNQEAAAILVRLAAKEEDKEKLLRNIDSLLATQQEETALALIEPKLREHPGDWELLYRQGVALAKRSSHEAAAKAFQSILALTLADEEQSTASKNRQKNTKIRATLPVGRTRPQNWRLDSTWEIRRAIGLEYQPYINQGGSRASIWSPGDFGLARMAAWGWLYRFAELDNTADEFIATCRERTDSPTATPHELWDWIYLQGVRQNHDGVHAAARRLCERGGLPEKQLYLMKLAARDGDDNVYVGRSGDAEQQDKTPPLPADELAMALAAFDEIRRMSPNPESDVNYYANAAALTILRELKRAGRTEEEQKLYDQIMSRASSLEGLSAAMRLAVQRRDRATFLSLYERFAEKDLQAADPKSNANSMWRQTVLQQIGQYIGQPDASPEDIVGTLDRFLRHHASKTNQRRSSPTFRPTPRALFSQQNNYVHLWTGNSQRYVPLPFPAPGDYFDREALAVIRGSFEYFRGKDLISDLVEHIQAASAKAAPAERLFFLLSLAYIDVWNDDRESAAATFAEAAALAPQDLDLKLEVAQLNIEMKQLDEALAIVDAIAPLDQRTMQRREAMALDLAVRLGDHNRAREAAQRLFGLRLDAETQVTLAGQMRRLGMNEEAQSVLARAQRQAGSRLNALAALMGQYQAQGNMDMAAQVAHQILRRSRTAPASQAAMGYFNTDAQSRTSALACLAQAGKIRELIAGLEEQIKRAPQASQLFETLGEYYQAAGETQKMLDLHAKIVSLRPEDADLRFRYAQELYKHGKASEACDEYVVVFKKQPRIMTNRYWEVVQAFQSARKEAELARTLSEINLKSIGQPWVVMNLVSSLMQNDKSRAAGMVLFKKAWEAFPEERGELMSNFYDEAAWKMPEVLEYAKKSLIPTDEAVRNNPWYGLYGGISFEGEGRINAVLHRLFDAMAGANQLTKLREQVAASMVEHPQWRGGPVILGLIDLRQGKPVDVAAVIRPLIDAPGNDYELCYTRWIVGQELADREGNGELAIKLLERAVLPNDDMNDQFEYSPKRALVQLYKESGQHDDARKLLLKAARAEPPRDNNYWFRVGQKADALVKIGKLLEEIEQPVDALKAYRELLIRPDFRDPTIRNYTGREPAYFQAQARDAMAALTRKIAQQPTGEMVEALLTPAEKSSGRNSVVDLMIATAAAGGGALPLLDSPFSGLIRPAGIAAEAAGRIEAQLDRLRGEHPRDMSVHIAAALFALKGSDAEKARSALARLNEVVAGAPLEALPSGKRANARQRAEAAEQIGLWLVARECFKQDDRRALAEPLAQRAIAAAQRQLETGELTAILYERGRLALEMKDSAAVEKLWSELIDLALVQPRLPRAAGKASEGTQRMPATLSQFKLGAAIAQAAAEHDLIPLSLQAIREVLSGGVPVADLPQTGTPAPPVFRPQGQPASRGDIDETVFAEMSDRMWQLSHVWKRHAFPAEQVCQLLEEIVFPAARPGDVLLYEKPLRDDLSKAQSAGRLLVEWAIRSARVGELQRQIAARQSSPSALVAGQVLLVQRAVLQGEIAKAREQLQTLAKSLESSKLTLLTDLAGHAAAMAIERPELMAAAAPILERLARDRSADERFVNSNSPKPQSPITILARHWLQAGNHAAAASQVEHYLQSRTALYGRFGGGDGALHIQRRDLAWGANELARGGDLATTLAALGRFADVTVGREGDASIDVALWHLARQARKLSPQQRYEQLRDWTLPTKDRRSVRIVSGFDRGQSVPTIFFGASPPAEAAYEAKPRRELLSNVTMLIEAAGEAGRMDQLLALVEPLATEKTPGAESLAILALLARGNDAAIAPRLDAMAQRIKEATPSANPQNRNDEEQKPARWEDYLVARAALSDKDLGVPARRLARHLSVQARRTGQLGIVARLDYDLAQASITGLSPSEREELPARLKHWTTLRTASQASGGELPRALWAVHEGHLAHRGSGVVDPLYFHCPLGGEFEFSYDAYLSADSQLALGYGGLTFQTMQAGSRLFISASPSDQISRPPLLENRNGWNHVVLKATPKSIRLSVNGHIVYHDRAPGQSSPWLTLSAAGTWPVMKNFRLTGATTVPREVRIVDGERLDGWSGAIYAARLPSRLQKAEPAQDLWDEDGNYLGAAGEEGAEDASESKALDWRAESGVLEGRLDPLATTSAPSLIQYARPLGEGQRLAYQFLYEPGKTHVHPALGSIAFVLDPAGVKLRWLADANEEDDPLLIDPHAATDDPSCRRGPAALPLKENDWNDVELLLTDGVLAIRLNSQVVCERPMEPTNDRRFGLFHDKSQTAAKIRSIALRGDWAESLAVDDGADLLALTTVAAGPALVRARQGLVGEQHLGSAAYNVWQQSLALAPSERYEFLKRWVLPSELHSTMRLAMDWTPVDPVPANGTRERPGKVAPRIAGRADREANASRSPAHVGGELVSPALELVNVAKELNKLDELATALAIAAKEYPDQARQVNALEAILAIARGDAATTIDRLTKGVERVKQQPAETPLHERQGEYLAAYAAVALPTARTAARTLAQEITTDQRPPRMVDAEWSRRTPRLRTITAWATDPVTRELPFGGGFSLNEWLAVSRATAKDRGEGFGPAAWKVTPGEVTYMTGSEGDALYYAVPLQGEFEVHAQITTAANRMVRLIYGGIALGLSADGTTLIKHVVGRPTPTRAPILEKINGWGPAVEAQLAVKDGSLVLRINGQQVHSELLQRGADPWLAIATGSGNQTGIVRSLQIRGAPTVPREISLSQRSGLEGWSAEYYGELTGSDRNRQNQPRQKSAWTKKGDEIIAGKFPNTAGSFRESVLQYHRPLAEDGELEYEFFYEPGKTEVHPAIDRVVFLLQPETTKLHWLTDAQYDRSRTAPENAEPLIGAKGATLKAGEWNKLKLTLSGDEAIVFVNGEQVARRTLESTNQRVFGLFRYSDATGVRVRNVVHRANWPTVLPPVEKQELATSPPPAANAGKGKAKAKAKK